MLIKLQLYDKFRDLTKIVIIFRDNVVIKNSKDFQENIFKFLQPYSIS